MMKPLLHRPSFIFFVTFLISTNISASVFADDNYDFRNCHAPFSCQSNITNLKYPFWGGNRDIYCGQPDMELTCEGSVPKITLNTIKYRILAWDDTTQKLTVARDDYWGGICLSNTNSGYKNNTFDNTQFMLDVGLIDNVTLLYDCPGDVTGTPVNNSETCDDGKVVYYIFEYYSEFVGCTKVIVQIFGTQVHSEIANALNDGFMLKWTGHYGACKTCIDSNGTCGYDGGQFRCVCKDGPHTTTCTSERVSLSGSSSKWNWRVKITIGASTAGVVVILILTMIICIHKKSFSLAKMRLIFNNNVSSPDRNVEDFMKSYGFLGPRRYRYSEVKKITNSFLKKLGQGGYGVVYKAELYDGRHVAVKLISETKGNGEEFINEVASISRTSHVNIVSLLGYCYERNKRALIYEYMPNGSLDKFIYKSGSTNAICDLSWTTLYQVAIGIARGLEYLHQGCSTKILHLDIKPQNILLDEDFCPKISDFGLAKICQKKESVVSLLGTRGTIGYIAPKVFSRIYGGVSHKSDVYSYGMLILEVIGGRKNYDSGGSQSSEMYFPDWIYKDLEQGNIPSQCLVNTEEENDMVMKITLVSLWCIQVNPFDRPSMSKVVELLEGPLQSISYPPKPMLYSHERSPLQFSNVTNFVSTQ